MKKYIGPLLAGVISVLLFSFILERSCSDPYSEYFRVKGQFESYKEETEKEKQEAQKIIQEKEALIAERDSQIEKLRDKNSVLEEEAGELREKDKAFEERIAELEALQGRGDLAQMYENMTAQRDEWKGRFFNERAEKEKVAGQRDNWARMYFKEHKKFLDQAQISENYKEQLARKEALLKLSEDLNERAEKRARRLKIGSDIKTAVIVGAAVLGGYAVFKELRGEKK
jgi:DNA repair exonuclease SbcCD ATPase subunit